MGKFDTIIQEINTNIADNNTQSITAKKLRDTLIDLTDTIVDVQDSFESDIDAEVSELGEEITNFETSVNGQISDINEEITDFETSVNGQISDINEEIDDIKEDITAYHPNDYSASYAGKIVGSDGSLVNATTAEALTKEYIIQQDVDYYANLFTTSTSSTNWPIAYYNGNTFISGERPIYGSGGSGPITRYKLTVPGNTTKVRIFGNITIEANLYNATSISDEIENINNEISDINEKLNENYDISENNGDTKYENLIDALGTNGENVPSEIRKGGMTIRFVNNSNVYEQWRYTDVSIDDEHFINVANWQGIDEVPTTGSKNLVTSDGIANLTIAFLNDILDLINDDITSTLISASGTFNGYLNNNGQWQQTGSTLFKTNYYDVSKYDILKIKHAGGQNYAKYGFFSSIPTSSSVPDSFVINETGNNGYDIIIIPDNGYITLSNVSSGLIECRKIKSITNLLGELKLDINSKIYNNLLDIIQPWIPNSSYAVGDIRKYNDTTYICNNEFTEGAEFTEANFTELSIVEAYKILLFSVLEKTSIAFEDAQYTAFTTGYLNKNGEWKSTSSNFGLGYFAVSKGDVVHIKDASANIKNYGIGYFEEIPTINSEPYYVEKVLPLGWNNNIVVSPIDGYILVPYMTTSGASKSKNLQQIIDSILSNIPIEPTELISTISSGYLVGKGVQKGKIAQYGSSQFKINCWQLQEGTNYVLVCDLANAYAASNDNAYLVGYGLNSQIPSANGPINFYYDMYANDKDKITISVQQPTYLIVNNILIQYFKLYEESDNAWTKVWGDIDELKTSVSECMSDYTNKTCIYIGDSISTGNNYRWKGLVEDAYNLKYVRNKSNVLWPANGGIKVMPLEDESGVELVNKSIWYRCAEQRMNIYDFDIISLFGGTNDMTDNTIVIGTENDIPYVDDASTFTVGSVTDVWSESLTFAQCLMGCIEMLKRDFPTKEIILCTVMPCGGSYGNWTDPITGLVASEAMANLQVRIANKYSLKVVPFYWNVRTVANAANKTFSLDTVHPNLSCALRMRASFAEILCL